jgi:Galactose oxidase, central domain/Putative Ig domain
MKLFALFVLACSLCMFTACGGGSSPPSRVQVAPTVTLSATPTSFTLGQSITLTWSSTNATTCTASSNPSESDWSGGEPISGSVSVVPPVAGTINYTLQCTGAGGSASAAASVTGTIGPLTITSSAPPDGTAGQLYSRRSIRCVRGSPGCHCFFSICFKFISSFPLTASGGVTPYVWTWAAVTGSSLPPGLAVLNGGTITGTPPTPGTYKVVITVTDSESPAVSTSANYTITIQKPPPPIIGADQPVPAGAIHLPYSFTFLISQGTPPLTWSAPSTPPGLSLSTDGVLSGTPSATGSFTLSLTLADSYGQSDTHDFEVDIFLHGFEATASAMQNPRFAHTAALLSNGNVLIAGGAGTAAELFDPASGGTFAATGDMASVHDDRATSTALAAPDTRVLVAGGAGISAAELYDPASGTFSSTGTMSTARQHHTATLLPNGKVLVAGGLDANGAVLASAELYDPATGTFSATGTMNTARRLHTATLLANGLVLIAGGVDANGQPLASAELYDPSAGTFAATGDLNTARYFHSATLIGNHKVLIVGGTGDGTNGVASAELFDTASGTFTATGTLKVPRYLHTATLLNDGTVLVAGGQSISQIPLASAELFHPSSGTFSFTGSMLTGRIEHTATLLNDGSVLVTGGIDPGGNILASAERYH